MEARNKKTGEVFRHFTISSEYGTATGIDENNILRIFTPADGAFEIIEEPSNTHGVIHDFDTPGVESGQLFVLPDLWHEFRCNAAKDFITGMMANPHYNMKADCTIVERSIELADELIRQLREKK